MKFLITSAINAVALWLTTLLVSGIRLQAHGNSDYISGALGHDGGRIVYFLIAGVVLALVNQFIRPVVKFLSLPFYFFTLGLFFLIVNAGMLMLTSWITSVFDMGLTVDGLGWAIVGGVFVGFFNFVIGLIVRPSRWEH
ncbi:phage holin family protein [Trueperella sp. LYQ143]|uniref:phage holin family protein n=1 Tax=unclassified Trueperella TaxID=2630174 RepID=UPI003983C21D